MAKKPKPGKCIYCLDFSESLTWDHVLPVSWYPDSTPKNIEKWKVPVCHKCNQKLGRIEEDLLLRLGLCLDPKSIASLGISHKVLRSVNPYFGKNERDRRIRENKRKMILKEIFHLEKPPPHGFFPYFGSDDNLIEGGYKGVYISDALLQPYSEKLVRGMSYVINNDVLGQEYLLELFILKEGEDPQLLNTFKDHSSVYHRGLGYQVRRLEQKDKQAWIYEFLIWQKFKFYVMVYPEYMKDKFNNS